MLLRGAAAEIIREDFGSIVMTALQVIDAHFQRPEVSIRHSEKLLRLLIDWTGATDNMALSCTISIGIFIEIA